MKHHERLIILTGLFILLLCFGAVSAKDSNTLVADTGFRVGTDGFSFENYGSQVCSSGYSMWGGDCYKVENLTSAEMVRLFGTQVCKSVDKNGKCTLTKVAERWMNEINQVVANGHCEGMAVLSSLFYSGIENPADFGSKSVNKLQLKGNSALQREIAYWFTTQWFMDDYLIENDPKTQLNYLIKHFDSDPNTVIPLGIYSCAGGGSFYGGGCTQTAGHAIAAYAVIDHGNGIYYVMVYDNNYPNEEKYITIDTNRNTWSYKTSTNPWSTAGNYSGSGKTNPIQIGPVEPRLGKFKCDFCTSQPSVQPSSNPWQPSQPSDGYDSIWDILSPWISPSDSGSPYTIPTQTPVPSQPSQPSQPSDSYDSIWDIFSPWMSPDDSGSSYTPTEVPDSGYSIWDIFAPWMGPDSGSSSNQPYVIPTQTPQTRQPTAVPTSKPLVRPTAIPTAVPAVSEGTVERNKISVNSDINIYIETDNDERAGYDWENDITFDEIEGVEIKRTMGRSSASLPNNLKYYLWMNSPESEDWKVFDAVITSPGRYVKLTNIPEAYGSPNFVYNPPAYNKSLGIEFESFEVIATGDQLPGVEFVITDEYGEYNFKFETVFRNGNRKTPDAPVDFLIFHNYDEGEIGIWVSALYDEDADQFSKSTFDVSAEFTLWDDEGELNVVTPKSKPISLKNDGMFFFNYVDWQNGEPLTVEADLDGDEKYETNRVLK